MVCFEVGDTVRFCSGIESSCERFGVIDYVAPKCIGITDLDGVHWLSFAPFYKVEKVDSNSPLSLRADELCKLFEEES